jgi:Domain of unknown function (DUF4387)
MPKLRDVCRYVRSKNAGPFWITVDLFFDGPDSFRRYRGDSAIAAPAIAALYGVDVQNVRRFEVDTLNVVKLSFPRLQPQGGAVERDMHGGQQYVPMLDIELG